MLRKADVDLADGFPVSIRPDVELAQFRIED
jgi:hypothetical protein